MNWKNEREKLERILKDEHSNYTATFKLSLYHALIRLDAAEATIARLAANPEVQKFAAKIFDEYSKRINLDE